MKKSKRLCLLLTFTILSCTGSGKKNQEIYEEKKSVIVEKVKRRDIVEKLPLMGDVKGFIEIDVFPKVYGKLLEYKVKEWERVERGDVIAVVDLDLTGMEYKPSLITSPVKGIVGKIYLDRGELVNPPTMSKNMGTPVAKIVQIDRVKVTVQIPERFINRIKPELPAEIISTDNPQINLTGKVTKVSPVLDPFTRTAEGEILVSNENFLLRPGMFVRVYIITDMKKNAVAVPYDAIVRREGKKYLMKVEKDVVKEVEVETGLSDSFVEIKNGIEEGDFVIISSPEILRDGDSVKVEEVR